MPTDRVRGPAAALLALAAGVADFLLVAVAVTELAGARVEFSLLVGLPVGLVFGLVTAALVGAGLSRAEGARYHLALAGGVAGAAFLLVGVAVALLASVTVGLLAGVGAATVAGGVALLRER